MNPMPGFAPTGIAPAKFVPIPARPAPIATPARLIPVTPFIATPANASYADNELAWQSSPAIWTTSHSNHPFSHFIIYYVNAKELPHRPLNKPLCQVLQDAGRSGLCLGIVLPLDLVQIPVAPEKPPVWRLIVVRLPHIATHWYQLPIPAQGTVAPYLFVLSLNWVLQ